MSIDAGTVAAYLTLDTGKYTSSLQTARQQMMIFSDESKTAGERVNALGAGMSTVGTALIKGATLPLVGVGTAITMVSAKFDAAMSEVKAISGATGEEFEMLSDKAKEMGESTKFSASEAAGAFKYMSLAGWDARQQVEAIDGVLNLAAAANMDLAKASDIVTDNMSAFALEASNAAHVADVYAYAQNNANTDVLGLGEAMKYVSLSAHNMNIDIETTSAMIGKLADVGLKGSMAGTSLNAMLRDMKKNAVDGKLEVGNMVVSLTDLNGSYRDIVDVVKDVETATKGMTDAQRDEALMNVVRDEGLRALNGLLAAGSDSIRDFAGEMYTLDGYAKEVADTMQDNLQGQITELKSKLEGIGITLGETLVPVVSDTVGVVKSVADAFAELNPGTQRFIVKAGLAAAAVGPFITAGGKLIQTGSKMLRTGKELLSGQALLTAATGRLTQAQIAESAAALKLVKAKEAQIVAALKGEVSKQAELAASVKLAKAQAEEAAANAKLAEAQRQRLTSLSLTAAATEREAAASVKNAGVKTEEALLELAAAKAQDAHSASSARLSLAKTELAAATQNVKLVEVEWLNVMNGAKSGDYAQGYYAIAEAKNTEALASANVTTLEAAEAKASLNAAAAKAAQTTATTANTGANWLNVASLKATAAAMLSNPLFIGMTAIAAVGGLISAVKRLNEVNQEVIDKSDELLRSYKNLDKELAGHNATVGELKQRYAELAQGVDDLGNNVRLSEEEYKEYHELQNKIADIFPDLVLGYDDEGNAILSLKGNVEELIVELDILISKQQEASNRKIIEDGASIYEGIREEVKKYKKEIERLQGSIDDLKRKQDNFKDAKFYNSEELEAFKRELESLGKTYEEILLNDWDGTQVTKIIFEDDGSLDEYLANMGNKFDKQIKYQEKQIEDLQDRITEAFYKFNPVITAYLKADFRYVDFDAQLQEITKKLVASMDFSTLNLKTNDEVKSYIENNILAPLSEAAPEAQQRLTEIFALQEQLESGKISVEEFTAEVQELFSHIFDGLDTKTQEEFAKLLGVSSEAGETFSSVVGSMASSMSVVTAAIAEHNAAQADTVTLTDGSTMSIRETEKAFEDLKKQYEDGEISLHEYLDGLGKQKTKISEVTKGNSDLKASFKAIVDNINGEMLGSLGDLTDATSDLMAKSENLTHVLKEQSEQGELCNNTIMSLIKDGYALALQIDEETGAVTLNADEYMRLTEEKINDLIADKELAKSTIEEKLREESDAASDAAGHYMLLAEEKYLAARAGDADLATLEAEIAMLKNLQSNLGNVNNSYKKVSSSKKASSKKDENKALEEYLDLLEHELDMGQLTKEQELARRREALELAREGHAEHKKLLEQIYDLEKLLRAEDIEDRKEAAEKIRDIEYDIYSVDSINEYFDSVHDALSRWLEDLEAVSAASVVEAEKYKTDIAGVNNLLLENEKNRSKAMLGNFMAESDKFVKEKEAFIARQKELDGLMQQDGTIFHFTAEDEMRIYQEILAERQRAIDEILKIERELTKEEKELLREREEAQQYYYDKIRSLAVQAAQDFESANQRLIELNKDMTKQLEDAQKKYADSVKRVREKLNSDLTKAHENYRKSVSDLNKKLIEEERKLTEAYESELDSRANSITNFVGIFSEVTKKDVSGQQLLDNLRDQLDTIKDWQKNLSELGSRGIDDALMAELEKLGPASASEIAALNTLTDEELDEYAAIYREKSVLAREEATSQMEQLRIEMQEQLQQLRADMDVEMAGLNSEYADKMAELNSTASQELAKLKSEYDDTTKAIKESFSGKMEELTGIMAASLAVLSEDMVDTVDTETAAILKAYTENGEDILREAQKNTKDLKGLEEDKTTKVKAELGNQEADVTKSSEKKKGIFKAEQIEQGRQEKAKSTNTQTEAARQEGIVLITAQNNINTLWSFVPEWRSVGRSYGDALLDGIQSTRSRIQSYLANVASAVRAAEEGSDRTINAYASGTGSAVRGLALVGEYGMPEIVDFSGGEAVLNFQQSIALMGRAASVAAEYTDALARGLFSGGDGGSSGIDYSKLGKSVASALGSKIKPSVSYSPTYNSPKPSTIAEQRKADKLALRRMGFSF